MITTAATPPPQTVVTGIIDGDGHIRERDEDLYPYFGAKYPLEQYRENKPLFTCPTRQHLLAPRPCPHGACLSAAPACQCWLLVRPPGWPPASRAAHPAGSKLRP